MASFPESYRGFGLWHQRIEGPFHFKSDVDGEQDFALASSRAVHAMRVNQLGTCFATTASDALESAQHMVDAYYADESFWEMESNVRLLEP